MCSALSDGRRRPSPGVLTIPAAGATKRILLALLLQTVLAWTPGNALAAPGMNPDAIRGEIRAGRYADAERHARQLLLETERLHGGESLEAADVLDLLAESMRRGGRTTEAEGLNACLRSLKIKERLLPPDDPSLAVSLENLGALRMMNGEHPGCREPLERALRIRIQSLGPSSPEVARSLVYLGNLEYSIAHVDSALSLLRRALAIQDSVLSPEDPARAQALNVLAVILYENGDYREAGVLFERVLALQTRAFGLEHPHTLNLLHNLGALCTEMGDYAEARRYLEEARAGLKRVLRPGHPLIARTLVVLASVHEFTGDQDGAIRLCREALAIQRKAYGSDHADVAWTLRKLGSLEAGRGRFAIARTELLQALRIQEKVLGPDHPDLGWTLSNLALAEAKAGDLDLALAHGARAREIQEKVLGPRHPDMAPTLAGLARFNAMNGDTAVALELALRGSRIRAEHLLLTSGGLSERQALAYSAAGPTGLDVALSLIAYPGALGTPAAVRQVWDAVLQTRTLVLDDAGARHRATLEDTTRGSAALAGLALRGARQRLANLLVRGPVGESADRYQAVLRRARLDMERAERDVGTRSADTRTDRDRPRLGLQDVFSAVPSGWGIVAYTSYVSDGMRSYVAFVRGAAGEPAAILIGDSKRIDGLVRRWAADVLSEPAETGPSAIKAESASRVSGEALRARIWDPLRGILGDAAGVIIIPEGTLHGVNFGALPDSGRSYLVEGSPLFHYISSELDIVTKRTAAPHGSGLLAIGGVDFGTSPEPGTRTRPGRERPVKASGDCTGFHDSKFLPLPQSRLEVEEIARSWEDSTPATVITGADASEAAFKRLAPGKRVLHLATHGFFLDPNGCVPEGTGVRGIGGLESAVRPGPRQAFHHQSPLLLSGLALANANRRSEVTPHEEDGVLTAEEVASLDLRGVEWAVLSACDTGLAGTSRGEGILGLRRAFQTAGVATLVISLWPVQDQAAREWMRALYQARFHTGVGTAQAVRDAMLEVLRSRRAQGRSTNPSFWAAFLAAGDWN